MRNQSNCKITVRNRSNLFVSMSQELEVTAKILLAKGGESSGFIRDDAQKTLAAMVCSLTPTRVLVALISGGARFVIKSNVSLF